jgi:ADP-dependent NAD(P)H-hydrate dehydratase
MNQELINHPAPLPARPPDGNKGTFGRLLIVGGNEEMIGAPVLAGMAALRMGAGLVQIALPQSVLPAALSICPELIGMGLHGPADTARLIDAAGKADALVIGPGLGTSDAARDRLLALLGLEKPMVVDADGLNLLAAMKRWPAEEFKAHAVLTPHPGEMRRLAALLPSDKTGAWQSHDTPIPSDDPARVAIATLAAATFDQVIILKGHRTLITDAQRLYINTTGDSTLAKAGSGDILSGVLGCLLGQRMDRFDAATLAVWLHGKAGELAGSRHGQRSALGRDVVDCLAQAIAELESKRAD